MSTAPSLLLKQLEQTPITLLITGLLDPQSLQIPIRANPSIEQVEITATLDNISKINYVNSWYEGKQSLLALSSLCIGDVLRIVRGGFLGIQVL